MLISYTKWIEILNNRLISFGQKILVVKFSKQTIELSNGMILTGSDFTKFKKRINNKKTDMWVKNSDNLFTGKISEHAIKSMIASKSGQICQQKHGHKIRQNLNTGTPWNKGKKGLPGTPHTKESKLKISEKNKGEQNGMFGKRMSTEQKLLHSQIMKQMILDGTFTPNSNNRNTHWNSYYNGRRYRSSWEALYQYFDEDALYEELRIPYYIDEVKKIYIVDFVNHNTKMCIEVKPDELCNGRLFDAKISALNEWAFEHQYSVLVVGKKWFKKQLTTNIDYSKFDESTQKKIKALVK